MSAGDSLTAWGIERGAEVVELAEAAGLALPIAATLLEKESGGRNVWGSDGVQTGGAYVKGGPVTRENYLAYRALVRAGRIGRQGVGPGQLTYGGYQDEADRRGGCWDWRINCRYSFEILRALQANHGTRGGFRRYNGSGPAAERYADEAMAKLARWTDRLGQRAPTPTTRPVAGQQEDDMTPEQERLLREVHAKLHGAHRTRVDFGLIGEMPSDYVDDIGGYAISADARSYETRALVLQLREQVRQLLIRPAAAGGGLTVDEVRAALTAALADLGPLHLIPERTTT